MKPIDTLGWRLDQIQHLLNDLINGKTLKGANLDTPKLLGYKMAVIEAEKSLDPAVLNKKITTY